MPAVRRPVMLVAPLCGRSPVAICSSERAAGHRRHVSGGQATSPSAIRLSAWAFSSAIGSPPRPWGSGHPAASGAHDDCHEPFTPGPRRSSFRQDPQRCPRLLAATRTRSDVRDPPSANTTTEGITMLGRHNYTQQDAGPRPSRGPGAAHGIQGAGQGARRGVDGPEGHVGARSPRAAPVQQHDARPRQALGAPASHGDRQERRRRERGGAAGPLADRQRRRPAGNNIIRYAAAESVLQLGIGDRIRLTTAQFEELHREADVGYTGASASVIFGCLSALDRPT